MTRRRNISGEILEGLADASAYLEGRKDHVRVTKVQVPAAVNVRTIRRHLKLSQPEFARRYALPLASLRKWEQGTRKPDAATRAYLTLIARNPRVVAETLAAA
ncbi:MAG TPA: transcriptional regulator [Stellaceae bacterium]|nr:transcriptional regulator [Stellaceae bacterium]